MKRPRRDKKGRIIKKKRDILPDVYQTFNFQITNDEDFHPYAYEVTDELADAVDFYRELCHSDPRLAIKELPAIIDRFPEVPLFKNHLMVAYKNLKMDKEAYAINDLTIKKHPDYIFAILNKAAQHYEEDELEKVVEVLGGFPLVINRAFPKRKVFHEREIFAFSNFLIHFFLKKGEKDAAQSHLDFIKDVIPDHPQIAEIQERITLFLLTDVFSELAEHSKKMEEKREKRKLSKKGKKKPDKKDTTQGELF